jgi:hypothetical protein
VAGSCSSSVFVEDPLGVDEAKDGRPPLGKR